MSHPVARMHGAVKASLSSANRRPTKPASIMIIGALMVAQLPRKTTTFARRAPLRCNDTATGKAA